MERVLSNSNTADAVKNTNDLVIKGNPDAWKLICKASSQNQGWMKSTKGMEFHGGVIVQVTSEFRDSNGILIACSDSVTTVNGAKLLGRGDDNDTYEII